MTWYIRASRQENVDDLYAPVIDEDSAGAHMYRSRWSRRRFGAYCTLTRFIKEPVASAQTRLARLRISVSRPWPRDSPCSGRYSVCRMVERRAFYQTVTRAVLSPSGLLPPGPADPVPGKVLEGARRRSMRCDPSRIMRQVSGDGTVGSQYFSRCVVQNVVDILQIYPQNAPPLAQTFGTDDWYALHSMDSSHP